MNIHDIPRAAGVSHFEQTAQMTPPLSVLLRCSLDKRALPQPKTSLYQRPTSSQDGFSISTVQHGEPNERLAATPSVNSNMPRSVLAEDLNNDRVTGREVAPLGNQVAPFDSVLLAQQSLQKRRKMLEEHACGRSSATVFGLPMSA